MINTCAICGKPIPDDELVTQQVMDVRQTHWSPAEWIDVVLHTWCANEPERDDEYERAAARARSNDFERTGGKDWT